MARLTAFPAFHKVSGRTVLIVGAGAAAAAKLRLLGETEARLVVVADEPGAELAGRRGASRRRDRCASLSRPDISTARARLRRDRGRGDGTARRRGRPRRGRAGQRRRPSRALRFLHAGHRQPRAARRRDRHRGRGAGAGAPSSAPGSRRCCRPARAARRARREPARRRGERWCPAGEPRRRFWAKFFDGPVADARAVRRRRPAPRPRRSA